MRTQGRIVLLAAVLVCAVVVVRAENIDPAADGHQYAWAENVGWINAEPNDDAGNGVIVADFTLTGWMWGENIGWISLSCNNTNICGVTPYGVANDGAGHLSGFAWSENDGWINFAPNTCLQDPTCGVKIDPATGYFSGRAWGENDGWITFSSGPPETWTARTSWCQGIAAAPGPVTGLSVAKLGLETSLSWTSTQGATWFDVTQGSLPTLRSSNGNFSVATSRCAAGRLPSNTVSIQDPTPPPGNGIWYLVRGSNCRGRGTYDDGTASQVAGRDAGIALSQRGCP